PEAAARYHKLEYLENEVTLTDDVQRLKATYVRDEQLVEARRMTAGGPLWGAHYGYGSGYGPSTDATPVQSVIIPAIGTAASSDYVLSTIDQLRAAQEDVLRAEQALAGEPVQPRQPPPRPDGERAGASKQPQPLPALVVWAQAIAARRQANETHAPETKPAVAMQTAPKTAPSQPASAPRVEEAPAPTANLWGTTLQAAWASGIALLSVVLRRL